MNDVAKKVDVFCPCCSIGQSYTCSVPQDYDPDKPQKYESIECTVCGLEWAIGISLVMEIWGRQQAEDKKK